MVVVVVPVSRLLPPSAPRASAFRPPSADCPRGFLQILRRRRYPSISRATTNGDNGGGDGGSETIDDGGKKEGSEAEAEAERTVAELKEMMAARKKEDRRPDDLWGGVAEEVGEIEWPAFGRVLSTTGVVVAVIAGSSVALLTVNAVLAAISDTAFAGKGIQDLFG